MEREPSPFDHADAPFLRELPRTRGAFLGSARSVVVEIVDDGVGFDISSLGPTSPGHFGIVHAMSLARWASGPNVTTSSPGIGTSADRTTAALNGTNAGTGAE